MGTAKILIVEDEGLVAQDIKHRILRMGYPAPFIVYTGEEAVTKAENTDLDLILMDIILSNGFIDGVQAAEQIHKFSDVPIIYLTASSDAQTLSRAKATGPDGYILKPFQSRELQIAIELTLYRHKIEKGFLEEDRLVSATLYNLQEGIVAVNRSGNICFINGAAQKLTGWSEPEASGRPLKEVVRILASSPSKDADIETLLKTESNRDIPSHGFIVSKDRVMTEVLTVNKFVIVEGELDLAYILVIRDFTDSISNNALK
ncbi:PAS domain S-box protein [Leptospira fainei serovar Hurstbridge str. BUT 6]|uniref:PAS domain S-box protein n=1 Tax=Leptospira fainei serovar Hurstbridge str. BUT 6 TaxID=1193011 RepID=S3UZ90_9LEPT|nr:response regulator [Leptospira fainei]EPG75746.1 PAS domain S-box protein [Leptospira fainei serovar Hurstbridge str. BUT 6]